MTQKELTKIVKAYGKAVEIEKKAKSEQRQLDATIYEELRQIVKAKKEVILTPPVKTKEGKTVVKISYDTRYPILFPEGRVHFEIEGDPDSGLAKFESYAAVLAQALKQI